MKSVILGSLLALLSVSAFAVGEVSSSNASQGCCVTCEMKKAGSGGSGCLIGSRTGFDKRQPASNAKKAKGKAAKATNT